MQECGLFWAKLSGEELISVIDSQALRNYLWREAPQTLIRISGKKKAFYMLMKVVAWFENKHNKSLIF